MTTHSKTHPKLKGRSAPDPFQLVSSVAIDVDSPRIEVPMLVLYGEWLKAAGFPIGSAAYLKIDERGELILRRIGLGIPRQLTIRQMPE